MPRRDAKNQQNDDAGQNQMDRDGKRLEWNLVVSASAQGSTPPAVDFIERITRAPWRGKSDGRMYSTSRCTRKYLQTGNAEPGAQLAGELVSREFQAVQVAECGDGDGFGFEEFVSQVREIFSSHGLDSLDQLIEVVESVEIHLLARQI